MNAGAPSVFAVPVDDLSPALLAQWLALAESAADCSSPFLHPSYARIVAKVRPGVEVAVITKDGEAVGFLPFERSAGGIGRSVGARLCDRSGAVRRPDVGWDVSDVARGARLRMLRLANVSMEEGVFRPYLSGKVIAPYIDLTDGYDAYRQASIHAGSGTMKRLDRRGRKLEAQLGPLRLVWHDTDDAVLDKLLVWKARQRRATRSPNVFDLPWARQLLAWLRLPQPDGFAGVLSALYAGETLCAAHFGICTGRVLHYWLAAYDEEMARCSPGLLLLMRMANEAAGRGLARLDLGPGDEDYKLHIASAHQDVAVATVCTGAAMGSLVRAAESVRLRARQSRALRATRRTLIRGAYLVRASLGSRGEDA
jgi:CelD/BcsL family acetyltransferase involved in cellulose biosynthesis